jgi:hypothetical protein
MNPGLDLRSEVRKGGMWMIVLSIGGFILGGILLAVGMVTGFMMCIAIPLLLASPFAGVWGLVQLVFPEVRLGHLGSGPQRTQVIQHIEMEARDPTTMFQTTKHGKLWLTPNWIVMTAGDEVLVTLRRDVLLVYTHVSRGRYSSNLSLKVRTRSKNYSCAMDEVEKDWFMSTFARATPWAYFGYDPRLAALPAQNLAWEVDQRAGQAQPQYLPR